MLESEDDPYLREQLIALYNPLYKGMQDAEQYFQNTDDIINEEDLEESVDESRRQSPITKMPSFQPARITATKENTAIDDKVKEAPKPAEVKAADKALEVAPDRNAEKSAGLKRQDTRKTGVLTSN